MTARKQDMHEIRLAAQEWRIRLSQPDLTDEDRRAFEVWHAADCRHEEAFDLAVTYWEAMGVVPKQHFDARIFEASAYEKRSSALAGFAQFLKDRWRQIGATAVAMAAMAFVIIVFSGTQTSNQPQYAVNEIEPVQYATEKGQVRELILADGSQVTLGSASIVEVAISAQTRDIRLQKGEALFDVVSDPDRPFSVSAGELTATALGTAFEVRHNAGTARVGVAEGRVEVSFPFWVSGQPTQLVTTRTLTAGHQVVASPQTGLRNLRVVEPEAVAAWRQGKLVYADATLQEIVADANRYSARLIELNDPDNVISELEVTISFDGADIATLLNLLPDVFPVRVIEGDDGVVRIMPETL